MSAKDLGRYSEACAFLDDWMQESSELDRWVLDAERFNAKAGSVRSRRITNLTWYRDPPSAPEPDVYAAADFSSEFENIDIHCGYVVWHQQADGSFRLSREEENYVEKSDQPPPESVLAAIRAKTGCAPR